MNVPVDAAEQTNRVLVLGAGGHDGPFLCQLLSTRFKVIATTRKYNHRLNAEDIEIVMGDLSDPAHLNRVIFESKPDLVVNLVSLSSVFECEKAPELSNEINYNFVTKLTDVLEKYTFQNEKKVRFLQASSSEIFGAHDGLCDELTNLAPITRYGKDKARAHDFLENYLSDYIEIKRAILFNHESEHRSPTFVSQKIATAAAKYRMGLKQELVLGNVYSSRDWGYAPDYMEAMLLILERSGNETYVVASGKLHSIQDLIKSAFGVSRDFDLSTLYAIDTSLLRKNETTPLVGSSMLLYKNCGWKPKVGFDNMVEKMVNFQINRLR
jgi:GDPmannose 4,6-dehydratase